MKRETGFRRTALITGALAAASLAGTAAVGAAAYASDSSHSTQQQQTTTTVGPSLSTDTGTDGGSQATSGGS